MLVVETAAPAAAAGAGGGGGGGEGGGGGRRGGVHARCKVKVVGLQGRGNLNGLHGIVRRDNAERARFEVLVGSENLIIREVNLVLAQTAANMEEEEEDEGEEQFESLCSALKDCCVILGAKNEGHDALKHYMAAGLKQQSPEHVCGFLGLQAWTPYTMERAALLWVLWLRKATTKKTKTIMIWLNLAAALVGQQKLHLGLRPGASG